ncbi:putative minor capsid protein [Clostridium sp. CAG:306]|nr:putative minor capsid protein [Clostridium sp. CAG:306]
MVAWGAIASIAGGLLGGAGSLGSGMLNFGQQKQMQQRQFDFQERMSSTAHQREVKDLRAAGLNPILSAMNGSGASTPSGGMGSINTPDYGASIREGVAAAAQLGRTKAETNFINQQAMTEQNKRENFDAQSALMRAEKIGREIENMNLPKKLKAELKEIASRVTVNLATASARQVEAVANKMNADTNRMVGKETARLNRESTKTQEKSNKFDKEHPWIYGTSKLLGGIGQVFSVKR